MHRDRTAGASDERFVCELAAGAAIVVVVAPFRSLCCVGGDGWLGGGSDWFAFMVCLAGRPRVSLGVMACVDGAGAALEERQGASAI